MLRILVGALACLVAVVVVAWLAAGGRLLCALASDRLPLRLDGLVIASCWSARPRDLPPAPVTLHVPTGRLRAIAAAASGRWIPPTVLRAGMGAAARWNDGELPPLDLDLELAVHGRQDQPPRVEAALPGPVLDALIARTLREPLVFGGQEAAWAYRFDPGSVLEDQGGPRTVPEGIERTFRVEASGGIELAIADERCQVVVRRLVGRLDVLLAKDPAGWRPRVVATVEELDSQPTRPPGLLMRVITGNLAQLIGFTLTQRLEAELEGVVLPPWTPTDAQVRVETR